MEMQTQQISTPDGISWHVEQFHPKSATGAQPQHMVLIPSGEGDCYNLRTIAVLLSSRHNFTVTTFDMPGFSRTTGPEAAITKIYPQLVAEQISTLLTTLKITTPAVIWGSSAGAITALTMAIKHSGQTKCIIIHEIPTRANASGGLQGLHDPPSPERDALIIRQVQHVFREIFVEEENGGREKWDALGPDYHERLKRNYLTWVDQMAIGPYREKSAELLWKTSELEFRKKPVFWTVGKLSAVDFWQDNWALAEKAGTKVNAERLDCKHFPHVTVPEDTVSWIVECVDKVKD